MRKIRFTKYSNERARRFALRTDIVDSGRERFVTKTPLYPEGKEHVRRIGRWQQELSRMYENTRIRLNDCRPDGEGLAFAYLDCVTLEQILDEYLLSGETKKAVELLLSYLEEVKKGFTDPEFTMTPAFAEVFGEARLPDGLLSGNPVDIDMVLNNVMVQDENWILIDYEWSFAFPVPYHFVAYRILNYYLNGSSSRSVLQGLGLYGRAGLTEEELELYEKMERHFQDVYVVSEGPGCRCHVPLRDLYDAVSPGSTDLKAIRFAEELEKKARGVQVFQAPDSRWNFTEENSAAGEVPPDGRFSGRFAVEPDSSYVRLDPCSRCCTVKDLQIRWGESVRPCHTNGVLQEDGSLFFATEDPQIIVKRPAGAPDEVRLSFCVEYLDKDAARLRLWELYEQQKHRLKRVTERLRQKEALIREMENTKVWKAYQKLKGKGK